MTLYAVEVTCPRCGTDVDHVTASATSPIVTLEARTVCACPLCRVEWLLVLELAPVAGVMAPGQHPASCVCTPCVNARRIIASEEPPRSHKRKVPA